MQPSKILLAFVPHQGRSSHSDLRMEEQDLIYQALAPAKAQGLCRMDWLNTHSGAEILTALNPDVKAFYYSGPSELLFLHQSDKLLPSLQEALRGLELVFFNSQLSKGQETALLNAGVRHVISTRRALRPEHAQHFAARFFTHLAQKQTVPEAFTRAGSDLGKEQKGRKPAKGTAAKPRALTSWNLASRPGSRSWRLTVPLFKRPSAWVPVVGSSLLMAMWALIYVLWPRPFSYELQIHGPGGPQDQALHGEGVVQLRYQEYVFTSDNIDESGIALFKNIPAAFRNREMKVGIPQYSDSPAAWRTLSQEEVIRLSGEGSYLELVPQASQARLEGKVVERVGVEAVAVSGAEVTLQDWRVLTDENGSFTFLLPPQQESKPPVYTVSKAGYLSRTDTLKLMASEAPQIELQRAEKESDSAD